MWGGLFVKGRGSLENYLVIKLTKFRGGKSSTDYKAKIEQEKLRFCDSLLELIMKVGKYFANYAAFGNVMFVSREWL